MITLEVVNQLCPYTGNSALSRLMWTLNLHIPGVRRVACMYKLSLTKCAVMICGGKVAEKASGVYTLYIDVIWEVGEFGISIIVTCSAVLWLNFD